MEALLMCVRITAAEVNYYSAQIAELDPDFVLERPSREAIGGKDAVVRDLRDVEQLNIWIRCRQKAILDLARYSKMSIDAGVAEKLVKVAQGVGESFGRAIKAMLTELDLTDDQWEKAPSIVRRQLLLLEGGKIEESA